MFQKFIALLSALFLAACSSTPVQLAPAAEPASSINIMSSGGFAAAYRVLGPQFEQETGIALDTAYGASSGGAADSIPERLKRNEAADVIILSKPSLERLTLEGYVIPESRTDLVRSRIGMAVREGAVVPDISSPEAFVTALRDAGSIGYSASASGNYLSTNLFPRIGIWEDIRPKSKRIESERVASVVARGDVEIGFQQISEILPVKGVTYVGPIPGEYQRTTIFSAGIIVGTQKRKEAELLIDFLSSEKVVEQINATGVDAIAEDRIEAES